MWPGYEATNLLYNSIFGILQLLSHAKIVINTRYKSVTTHQLPALLHMAHTYNNKDGNKFVIICVMVIRVVRNLHLVTQNLQV